MVPEFQDGHIIIVDPSHPLCDQAFVVLEYQGEIHFGLYREKAHAHPELIQLKHEDEPLVLHDPFELKGVVVQRSSGRRRNIKHYHYSV